MAIGNRQEGVLIYHPSSVSWVTAEFVRRPPAWMPRCFLYALTASLLAGVGYASFARVAIHVDARGQLETEPGIMPIAVPVAFKVAKLYVHENQAVKRGDRLLSTEDQLPESELDRLRGVTDAIRVLLVAHRAGECANFRSRLARVAQDALVVHGVPEIEATLAPARDAVNRLLAALGQYDDVDEVTASARRVIAVNSGKIEQVRQNHGEDLLRREVEQLTNEIVASRNQMAERQQTLTSAVGQARDELDVRLATVLGALEVYRAQRDVVAPVDGVVHGLTLRGQGQYVAAGTEVLQLVPEGATFVAELAVTNKDVSHLRVGLPVIVRLDAFPERQYGAIDGSVEAVPLTTSSGDANAPVYRVVVHLDRQSLRKGGTEYPFRIGMQLEGRVVTRHESMLVNGVRKLLSLADDLDG